MKFLFLKYQGILYKVVLNHSCFIMKFFQRLSFKGVNKIEINYPGFDNDEIAGDGAVFWQTALDFVAGINDGTYSLCGGTPPYNDWRLPNYREFYEIGNGNIYLTKHPFINLSMDNRGCWSSTTVMVSPDEAYYFRNGLSTLQKYYPWYVWPVRGGH